MSDNGGPGTAPELVSVGDRVGRGRYRLHSRFAGALIFAREAREAREARRREARQPGRRPAPDFACVVDESKGEGPINVTVRGLDFMRTDSLEVHPARVVLGGVALEIKRRYDSNLRINPLDAKKLESNLRAFERALLESASAKSLVFLLDPSRERNFTSTFEKEFARRLRAGVGRLVSGELGGGAAAIKGLGFGLTPSGDDFLAGFLLGLHALDTAGASHCKDERRAVDRAAHSGNPFSNVFLRLAAEGRCFERARPLIQGLFEGGEAEVARYARCLLSVGATSGADLGVGLLFALKRGHGRKR